MSMDIVPSTRFRARPSWAYVRRKFHDASGIFLGMAGLKSPDAPAYAGLSFCKRLYAIEAKCRTLTPEERHAVRQEKSVPVLNEIRTWLDPIRLDGTAQEPPWHGGGVLLQPVAQAEGLSGRWPSGD